MELNAALKAPDVIDEEGEGSSDSDLESFHSDDVE